VKINETLSYDENQAIYRSLIYDASIDEVVDEINPSHNTSNYKLISNNNYIYFKDSILYVRDIREHSDIKIGRLYRPSLYTVYDMDLPLIFPLSGDVFYALIHESEEAVNPDFQSPQKDDLMRLIQWDIKSNTKTDVTNHTFNFPFGFTLLDGNTILI